MEGPAQPRFREVPVRCSKTTAWVMSLVLLALMIGVPFVYYRYQYTYAKRLRPVTEGKFYRSGCMTAAGFADAIRTHRIRTVINLMEDNTDPNLPAGYFDLSATRESELCNRLGARMINLSLDLLPPNHPPEQQPAAIAAFLAIMDQPETHPALIHCRAGLHRTGVMVAIYRMEYEGWTCSEAMSELKAHGFGDYAATAANDYIAQYVLPYKSRLSRLRAEWRHQFCDPQPSVLTPDRVHGGVGPGF